MSILNVGEPQLELTRLEKLHIELSSNPGNIEVSEASDDFMDFMEESMEETFSQR